MINFILVVYRYADYVKRMVATPQYLPHKNTVFLKSVSISPIPIFNKARYIQGITIICFQVKFKKLSLMYDRKYHHKRGIFDTSFDIKVKHSVVAELTPATRLAPFDIRSSISLKRSRSSFLTVYMSVSNECYQISLEVKKI